jgi:hypothetical protein
MYTINDIYERYVKNTSNIGEVDRNVWGNYLINYSNNNVDNTIIDTDELNSYLVLSSLYLLKNMNLGKLDLINVFSEGILNQTIKLRPPCRWETNLIEVPTNSDSCNCNNNSNNNNNINTIDNNNNNNSNNNNTIDKVNRMRCIDVNKDVIEKGRNRYVEVVLDIAHNPAAISALVRKIKR